ncbi:hypothetical protein EBO34_19905 [Alteribacter keqinensis]|uniref:Uncharacterized protein n=1 Tax=Alteribacter keqinensis TaxID=2483800 RepID=A0A3M7TL69_9BACI|nr:hypothetical protein EBO34_19905 [Alteribacter keqinensis]
MGFLNRAGGTKNKERQCHMNRSMVDGNPAIPAHIHTAHQGKIIPKIAVTGQATYNYDRYYSFGNE